MEVIPLTERTLTTHDHARLARLLAQQPLGGSAASLHEVLDTSDLVGAEPAPTLVTMGSRVLLQDAAGDAPPYELTLCWPGDARPADGCISVLSPVGASLLGLPVGATARWRLPGGQQGAARILAVLYQPERHAEVAS